MSDRRRKMLQGLDVAHGAGIEIGALAWPIVTRAEGDITYVDWTDAETLRRKYAHDPHVDIGRIVEVDAIWGDKTLRDAIGGDRLFDYVIASHVIEHVPDLISWVRELLGVLKDGGEVRLAVPDKRFTFDFLRRETELADVLEAYLHGARRPTVGAVLDFFINYVEVDAVGMWNKTVDVATLCRKPVNVPNGIETARRVMSGEYVDVHCWVFTPASFVRLMEQLVSGGFLDCRCSSFFDTAAAEYEFFVGLRHETDRAAAVESWRRFGGTVPEPGAGSDAERDGGSGSRPARANAREALLAARLAEAERQVAALKNSRSWRITAPLRRVSNLLGRR